MNAELLIAIACALAAVGAGYWAVAERGRAARLALQVRLTEEKARLVEEQAAANAETVRAQAAASASAVAETLVQRATETFQAQDRLAQAKLEAQLKPVADTLAKFQEHVAAVEKSRAEDAGGLKAQIQALMAASVATQDEARKLSAALRRGAGVQGRWGEQVLRNVLEMAGLRPKIDFEEQVVLDAGAARPDVTVRLPGGGVFVIDAKCSLNGFLEAQDAADEASRDAAYMRHAASVRTHVQSLAAKAYWDKLDLSPDFVVMFVPGDAFLAAAAERLPDLYTEAMDKRVILTTPSSLFALCKAVAYGWRVEQQALNAQEVAALGAELYKRLSVMGGHIGAMGRALGSAVGKYNEFVGSLEAQVLTQARRFEDLKVDHQGKSLDAPQPLEVGVRPLAKLVESQASDIASALTQREAAPTSAA